MGQGERDIIPAIELETPEHRLTISLEPRTVSVYYLLEHEIDQFTAGYSSLDLTFFGLSVGALITVGIAWLTSQPKGDALSVMVALAAVSVVGVAYFGLRVILTQRQLSQLRKRLRDRSRSLPPAGGLLT